MAALIQYLIDQHNYISYEMPGIQTHGFFLMGSPFPVIFIVFLYVYFCKYTGPKFMEKRPAFSLTTTMLLYNLFQVVANAAVFIAGMGLLYRYFSRGGDSRCYLKTEGYNEESTPEEFAILIQDTTNTGFYFVMLKITDLLDTVFMVLRKNYHQITILHLYHHGGMVLLTWYMIKHFERAHEGNVVIVNCFVHVIMYSYYLGSAYNPKLKSNITLKKSITILQITQFVYVLMLNIYVLSDFNCPVSVTLCILQLAQAIAMIVLFSNFYYHAYILRPKLRKSK